MERDDTQPSSSFGGSNSYEADRVRGGRELIGWLDCGEVWTVEAGVGAKTAQGLVCGMAMSNECNGKHW